MSLKLYEEHKWLDPFKISMLARKQGLNMLNSTAQWTWINIIRAHFYIQACQEANFQAVNCFSLIFSAVLFDIRGDYQLKYLYLACLLVEQAYTEATLWTSITAATWPIYMWQFICHKPTRSGSGSKPNFHWGRTNFWQWRTHSLRILFCPVTTRG